MSGIFPIGIYEYESFEHFALLSQSSSNVKSDVHLGKKKKRRKKKETFFFQCVKETESLRDHFPNHFLNCPIENFC